MLTEEEKQAIKFLLDLAEEEAIKTGEYTEYKAAEKILKKLLIKKEKITV